MRAERTGFWSQGSEGSEGGWVGDEEVVEGGNEKVGEREVEVGVEVGDVEVERGNEKMGEREVGVGVEVGVVKVSSSVVVMVAHVKVALMMGAILMVWVG